MAITAQQIRETALEQVKDYANGVKDISAELIQKAANQLKQAGVPEKTTTDLLHRFFLMPLKGSRESSIMMYGGGNCDVVSKAYIEQHFNNKYVFQALINVVGYASFPMFGPYVLQGGKVFFNKWRPIQQLFTTEEMMECQQKGIESYNEGLEVFLASKGTKESDVGLYEAMKPQVWLALEKLWFPNKPEEAKIFTDWASWVVTLPSYRIRWAPLLRSDQRLGKGTVVEEVMRTLLGAYEVTEVDYKRLTGQFSGDQLLNRLVVLNEVKATRVEQYNMLKHVITDDFHHVERKGENAFLTRTYYATLLCTNYEKPLTIPKGDGRYWVPDFIHYPKSWGDSEAEQQRNSAKFFELWRKSMREEGGLKKLSMFFLWNVLSGNAERYDSAPASEAKDDLISHRTEDAEDKLTMYLGTKVSDYEGVKLTDIQKHFEYALNDTATRRILKECGFENHKLSIPLGTGKTKQMRVWSKTKDVDKIHEPKPNWLKN